MCGILFVFTGYEDRIDRRAILHRGPDKHIEHTTSAGLFVFDRLAINGLGDAGDQPIVANGNALVCNGEIYNYDMLRNIMRTSESSSDCAVLFDLLLSQSDHEVVFRTVEGEFSCVFFDNTRKEIVVARDSFGVRPLFVAIDEFTGDTIGFASEAKSFTTNNLVTQFPPGCYWKSTTREYVKYALDPSFKPVLDESSYGVHVQHVQRLVTNAVSARLAMNERSKPAFFLSGGLDSSIVAAIASSLSDGPIDTFSIGTVNDSPDLMAARIVADHIGSRHVVVEFTPDEAIEYIPRVIYHLESYDCTTVRAAVPMYILSEYIAKHTDHKVVLSGEGADELFGGYLYFQNAPTHQDFHDETIRLLKNIHQYDGLRADRCTAGNGLEVRVPFLDPMLVSYVTTRVPTAMKHPLENNGVEKGILRAAFAHLLPAEIINRQKNGMSDAVGYEWVDFLRKVAGSKVSKENNREYLRNPPQSDEERWYRQIHESFFGTGVVSHQEIWRPRWTDVIDPSARCLKKIFMY